MNKAVLVPALASVSAALLSGCSLLGGASSTSANGVTPSSGPTWQVTMQGSATPSPPGSTYRPPSNTPLAYLSPDPTSATTPSMSASPCIGHIRVDTFVGLGATPGSGSATLDWPNVPDPAVEGYRLAAVPQAPTNGVSTPIYMDRAAGTGCEQLTARFGGLKSGAYYSFWLVAKVRQDAGVVQQFQVGRSMSIKIN